MAKKFRNLNLGTIVFLVILVSTSLFVAGVFLHRRYSTGALPAVVAVRSSQFPEFGPLLMMFLGMYFAYFVEALLQRYHVHTPYSVFVVMVAYSWGIWIYHDSSVRAVFFSRLDISPRDLLMVYVPITVFNISFNVDVPTFKRTLSQILVVGGPVCITQCCLFGIISGYIIEPDWSTRVGIIFGVFCAPIQPHIITRILKQQNPRTKQISTLLEGESLIEFFISDICQKLVMGQLFEYTRRWYQFSAVVLRALVLGSITGYVFGCVGKALMRRMYTDRLSIILVCFGLPLFAFQVSENHISGCGSMSVIVMGLMLSTEKTLLPKETEKFLVDFWALANIFVSVIVLMKASVVTAVAVAPLMQWQDYPLLLVVYLMNFMMRLVSFLLFSPITSRLGYGMDLKSLIVCAWGGVKNVYTLLMSIHFLGEHVREQDTRTFLFYILGLYFFSVLINGSFTTVILDFLGLRKISLARQVNMNNCIRHIFAKRQKTIAILKTDRFLADANWPLVVENTTMTHPYHLGLQDDEDDDVALGYRYTWCGDCKKDILQEPTPKELKEITREAKQRILKAKKMSYSRQYEMGMMTKEGIIVLGHKTEIAMESEDADVDIATMHNKFIAENCWIRCFRKLAAKCTTKRQCRRPRTYWRRLCYNIVLKNRTFDKTMISVVAVHVLVLIVATVYHPGAHHGRTGPEHSILFDYAIMAFRILFVCIYVVECVMTIMAYSWIHVCRHGLRRYFSSFWHVQDFLVMAGLTLNVVLDCKMQMWHHHDVQESAFHEALDVWNFLRCVKFLKLFQVLAPDLVNHFDKKLDAVNAKAFEIGKCYASAEGEILEMLPYVIDNMKIRTEMRQSIEKDRLTIYHLLGVVQKERPWVAITVKTTQAIRMILNGMKQATNQLKSSGWVDAYEYEKLTTALEELYKGVNAIKKVEPSPPNVLFKEVSWMADDDATIEFLFENVVLRQFESGKVVFEQGGVADGIYIVVTGLFILNYVPEAKTLENLKRNGVIPILDFPNSRNYDDKCLEYVVSGACVGELSILTGRPYDCSVTSDGHSQAYFISQPVLKRAMELSADPIGGLERRIWKEVAVRIAQPVLKTAAVYQSFTQDQIKYALERAFVPDLDNIKIFAVTDMIEDIVLIEGVILDFNTKDMYTAPCYVPRTVQKLVLSQSSQLSFFTDVKTNLLIIPSKDVDEYDIMLNAEEVCELVNNTPEMKCLRHAVQDKKLQRRRRVRSRQKTIASQMSGIESNASSLGTSSYSLDTAESASSYQYTVRP